MMFCTNCGKEVSDTAKFCGYCGKMIIQQPSNNQKSSNCQPQKSSRILSIHQEKKKWKPWVIPCIILSMLLALISSIINPVTLDKANTIHDAAFNLGSIIGSYVGISVRYMMFISAIILLVTWILGKISLQKK